MLHKHLQITCYQYLTSNVLLKDTEVGKSENHFTVHVHLRLYYSVHCSITDGSGWFTIFQCCSRTSIFAFWWSLQVLIIQKKSKISFITLLLFIIYRAKYICTNGIQYSEGSVVVLSVVIQSRFGLIKDVLIYDVDDCVLVCEILECEGFVEHFHAYNVCRQNPILLSFCKQTDFKDYHTLSLHQKGTSLYIVTKYHLLWLLSHYLDKLFFLNVKLWMFEKIHTFGVLTHSWCVVLYGVLCTLVFSRCVHSDHSG